jgi:hypothetical protein
VDQLVEMQTDTILREYPIDLTHLGILFMLDRSRRCKFYLEDIMHFIELCYEREQGNRESHELQQMVTCALSSSLSRPLTHAHAHAHAHAPPHTHHRTRTRTQTKFQAYCTLHMWNFITSQGGHQRFVKWMTGLFVEIKDVKHFKAHPHVMFLDTDVLRSIHKVGQSGLGLN